MRLVEPSLPYISCHPCLRLYDEPKAQPAAWEQRVRDRYAGRFVTPAEVRRAPGDFILCFSFWDIKNLIDIRPRGGRYVYSSSEAYSEEQMTDLTFTRSPNMKSAYTAGASRPDKRQRPNSDVTNIGISNSFISHLPFCPKAIHST